MKLDALLNRFRIASRELFNHFFRVDDPYNKEDAWNLEESYGEVEGLLFQKLVIEPADLSIIPYGKLHPNILVQLRHSDFCPVMLNREIDCGYWDFPLEEITREAQLSFISFFDWDQLDYRDHRYVRVQITQWPSQPNAVGKHALIETQYVCFAKG